MPYFSTPVPELALQQSGSFTKFETVVHKNYKICRVAAEQIQAEFNKAMNTDIITNTVATVPGLGLVHFLAFTIPNCLPERLVALVRFAEFTLLNDDFYDIAKNEEINKINADIQSVLATETESRTAESLSNMTKSKQLQASLILDMINIDSELAMDIMTTYSKGLELATFPPDTLKTLEDYLPVRMVNSGLDVFQTMSCFGMGITLTPSEKARLADLVDTAMFSTTMINDIHSWPKEVKHHIEHPGSEYPFNAVAVLMRHQGCSEAQAVRLLREKQASLQEQHLELLRRLGPLPEHQMLYVLAAQYAASGSEFWSIHVPRYPSKEDLNQPEVEFVDGVFRYKHNSGPATTTLFQIGRETTKSTKVGVVEINVLPCPAPTTSSSASSPRIAILESEPEIAIQDVSNMANGDDDILVEAVAHVNANGDGKSSLNGETFGLAFNQPAASRSYSSGSCTSLDTDVACTDEIIMAPYRYLTSMPSKGIRDLFITALNWWLQVPEAELLAIKDVISYLHQSSLMLDDIEDNSQLRRGQPATHIVYGLGQTINSANYIFVQAFSRMQALCAANSSTLGMFIEEVENLHKGQSYDLFWKDHVECPSVDEYLMMIDQKTGGLFRLCVRLMEALATREIPEASSKDFVRQLSRYFQIRDDYQNLMSDQYAKEKGFAEDLDEGKISLPLIYTLQSSPNRDAIARVFKRRDAGQMMGIEMKKFIIGEMRKAGALDRTYRLLRSMQDDMMDELRRLERVFGAPNASLELVLRKMWID
ncbi:polyprenyl synthetase [Diaporthe helianthi]|uniref:Polyprenyl synthetase n=1 Tax=Diaporthe helianthi TaxID=158607 RepID=A0A2P5HPH8_DIAHE|nr:polyprenyl synthetase [Diaporthe helianthi]